MSKLKIVVQAGHIAPREPGFESGTGTVREQEFTRKLRDRLCKMLEDDGRFDAIPVPGDIPNGVKCDAALFEHGDGSSSSKATGFSFGYPQYPVNAKLAGLIAGEYLKLPGHPPHHADNYTNDLKGYYGFSRVDTPGPEVLVESGFLTNPHEQAWMFANLDELAGAQYRALLAYFKLGLPNDTWSPGDPVWQNLPGPKPKPAWFWDAVKEIDRRREL